MGQTQTQLHQLLEKQFKETSYMCIWLICMYVQKPGNKDRVSLQANVGISFMQWEEPLSLTL